MNSFFNLASKPASSLAAIDDSSACITYGELAAFSEEFASVVPSRSFAYLFCKNSIDAVKMLVSCIESGVVVFLADAGMDLGLMDESLNHYLPQYIIAPSEMEGLPESIELQASFGSYSIYRFNKSEMDIYDELAILLSTSGSTGSSKLVRVSYDNLRANTESIVEYLEIDESSRPITSLPFSYSYGMTVVNTCIYAGGTLVVTDKSVTQRDFWDFLVNAKATVFSGVPFTYEMLKRMRLMSKSFPDMRVFTQAGGHLASELQAEFAKWANERNQKFFIMYGQTEASPRISYLPAELCSEKIGSIGIGIPRVELHLEDDRGNIIEGAGIEGELVCVGANVSLGYATKPEDFALGDENHGVLHTGDLCKRDEDGCYFITGRMKRFVKLYGKRVSLDECEEILKSNLEIDCACAGRDDMLCIYLLDEEQGPEARKLLTGKLGIHPKAVTYMRLDEIPKSNSGKISYKELPKC